MRPKDQRQRRRQLAEAARRVLLERGAIGLRIKDVAERAGLASSSVLYYYPDIGDLLLEVASDAMNRYAERRAKEVKRVPDPPGQLRLAIELGVPTGPDDEESRLLYEIDALTGTSRAFEVLSRAFFDRQAMTYESTLEAGARSGDFELVGEAAQIARGMVALEDGLGLQVVISNPAIDTDAAKAILLGHARAATGYDLAGTALPIASG
jgi:AcrR family transcriptional regulator